MSNENTTPEQPAKRSAAQVRSDIAQTRHELAETLDALEYKFDVPSRLGDWAADRKTQAQRLWNDNPALTVGVLAGTVAIIGGIIAGAFMLPRRGR